MDVIGAQDRLAVALSGVVDDVDDVIIDCPPSLGLLTVNALFAADAVLIVAEPAAWSADGVEQILLNVSRIAERRGGRPEVAGIVVNRLGRTRDAAYWAGQLAETHPSLVIEPAVRLRVLRSPRLLRSRCPCMRCAATARPRPPTSSTAWRCASAWVRQRPNRCRLELESSDGRL